MCVCVCVHKFLKGKAVISTKFKIMVISRKREGCRKREDHRSTFNFLDNALVIKINSVVLGNLFNIYILHLHVFLISQVLL